MIPVQVVGRPFISGAHDGHVGIHRLALAFEQEHQRLVQLIQRNIQQPGQRADVDHVGDVVLQLAFHARVADEHIDGHGVVGDVIPLGDRAPVAVVEADAAGRQRLDVLDDCHLVERHQNLRRMAAGGVAVLAQPDVIPRRQSLNIRREDIFPVDGDAHLEQRAQDSQVGGLAAGAVGRRHDDRIIVDDEVSVRPAFLR